MNARFTPASLLAVASLLAAFATGCTTLGSREDAHAPTPWFGEEPLTDVVRAAPPSDGDIVFEPKEKDAPAPRAAEAKHIAAPNRSDRSREHVGGE